MSDIPTWHERAMAHPDHQSGMISEDMIRARMAEEVEDLRAVAAGILSGKYTITSVYVLVNQVDDLARERDEARAEVERQARHIEELRSKIDADRSCACSFDAPGDVCAAHSPALAEARAEVDRLREALRIFRINGPDSSGLVWLSFSLEGGVRVSFQVGHEEEMVSRYLLEFEQIRRNALENKP